MKPVYMISDTGALKFTTNRSRRLIKELEKLGYWVCSREEFRAKRRSQRREEKANEEKICS